MRGSSADEARWIRIAAWGGTAALVLLPLLALKAFDANAWQLADLPFALVMAAAVGIAFEFALRIPARLARPAGTLAALGTGLLLVWGNLAVGFAGSEDNAINAIFFAVPLLALAGSLIAGLRSAGVSLALAAAAALQVALGAAAWFDGFFTGPLTVAFAGLWLAAALLFRRDSLERSGAPGSALLTPGRDRAANR